MEGKGAYTVVDGHHITLGANDYVLAPNGALHDHGVVAEGEVSIWQDGLDIPLMNSLETNFYAVYDRPAHTATFSRPASLSLSSVTTRRPASSGFTRSSA